jgi:hypothetical protein
MVQVELYLVAAYSNMDDSAFQFPQISKAHPWLFACGCFFVLRAAS